MKRFGKPVHKKNKGTKFYTIVIERKKVNKLH